MCVSFRSAVSGATATEMMAILSSSRPIRSLRATSRTQLPGAQRPHRLSTVTVDRLACASLAPTRFLRWGGHEGPVRTSARRAGLYSRHGEVLGGGHWGGETIPGP